MFFIIFLLKKAPFYSAVYASLEFLIIAYIVFLLLFVLPDILQSKEIPFHSCRILPLLQHTRAHVCTPRKLEFIRKSGVLGWNSNSGLKLLESRNQNIKRICKLKVLHVWRFSFRNRCFIRYQIFLHLLYIHCNIYIQYICIYIYIRLGQFV